MRSAVVRFARPSLLWQAGWGIVSRVRPGTDLARMRLFAGRASGCLNAARRGVAVVVQRERARLELTQDGVNSRLHRRIVRAVARNELLDDGPQRRGGQLSVRNLHRLRARPRAGNCRLFGALAFALGLSLLGGFLLLALFLVLLAAFVAHDKTLSMSRLAPVVYVALCDLLLRCRTEVSNEFARPRGDLSGEHSPQVRRNAA